MITHLSKEENRTIRRQLLTDIVYAISHDELTKIRPKHTQLTPVEIYLSARVFVKNLLELSDIDEGLDDEIRDLQDECMSENEAMVILVISSLILGVNNKKNPDEKLHNIILKIFQRTQGNELFMPLLKQFADKEVERIAQGKIIEWIDYEFQEILTNNEGDESLKSFAQNIVNAAKEMDVDTIKHTILIVSKSNNNSIVDGLVKDLYDILNSKSQNITQIEELVLTKHVQTQIGTVESGGTGNINNTKSTQL